MPLQEEDWGQDFNFDSENGYFFQRRDLFHFEPDKDLVLACEKYLNHGPYQSYSEDDDTNSSIYSFSTSSFISSRYSTMDLDSHIDKYILNVPSTQPTTKKHPFPGVIQRLTPPTREIQDLSDWKDDIEIPSNSSFKQPLKKNYDAMLSMLDDFDDIDIGPSVSQRASPIKSSYTFEREQDGVDELSGLHFPQDLSILSQRLQEKKHANYDLTPSSKASKLPIATRSSKKTTAMLSNIAKENDDDDFLEGLDIKDTKVFNAASIKQKGKEPMTSRLTNRLTQRAINSEIKSSKRFLSSTQSSLHREAATKRPNQPKQSKIPLKNTRFSHDIHSDKKSPSGYTLISKPKTKPSTSYCSRLDSIDNLNDLAPKKKLNLTIKPAKDIDPNRPWRANMQKTLVTNNKKGQGKVTLIKPNDRQLKKEYNDMKYDEKTHQWKGNEKSLTAFQTKKSSSRLMLMTNKQQKPSKYAAAMSNNMIFNPDLQKWVSAFGEECNELDEIQDLREQSIRKSSTCLEYTLTTEVKQHMFIEQQEHQAWMSHWPLDTNEPQFTTESGHKVAASKYFLKIRLF